MDAYHRWGADRIIAETNNGGEMVETVIRMIDKNVSFKASADAFNELADNFVRKAEKNRI